MNWEQSYFSHLLGVYQPVIVLVFALLLDKFLGEPRRLHPLVGFGGIAKKVESISYGNASTSRNMRRMRGVFAICLLIIPPVVIAGLLVNPYESLSHRLGMGASTITWQVLLEILIVYLAIGGKSLINHANAVINPLQSNNLNNARLAVGKIVSRETRQMKQSDVIRATVESVLENGNDAVFAAIFWYLIAGVPGVVAYRLVNTLDAMWGYRNDRYQYFGWSAARLDDVMNWIPARLCALTYALLGNRLLALRSWQTQSAHWDSPNAGPVIAAGAGALGISLGGAARYGGVVHQRPYVGSGPNPTVMDITRAVNLVRGGLVVWLGIITVGIWLIA